MINELVRHYDTLKRCNVPVSDPYFDKLEVWVEIVLTHDGSFRHVNWLGKPKEKDKKKGKEEACRDFDCPMTEKSACRSSGNDSPHGLVDNAMWIFGKFATEKQQQKSQQTQKRKGVGTQNKKNDSPAEVRRMAYLNQIEVFYNRNPGKLGEIKAIYECLRSDSERTKVWIVLEELLKAKIIDGKGVKLIEKNKRKWQSIASKANIRWVVERMGGSGKPVNSLPNVKNEWQVFRESRNEWWITSLMDGRRKPARVLHPRVRGASLISFNNAATYCGHLSTEYRGKPGKEDEETDGSALPAQVGFEEAEKYSKALEWLIENSSVRFGETVSCVWIDQAQSAGRELDKSGHDLIAPQGQRTVFKRGKAGASKGQVLAHTGDLLATLRRFRNGQPAGYRDKRFYLLSLLLRRKGRHAILGGYTGTMGLLDDNTDLFVSNTQIMIPIRYLHKKDKAREFCPTLMDILSAAGIKAEKKQRLVWDREVVEVIVAGRSLPPDLCRLVISEAVKHKHLEPSQKTRAEYLALLAIAAGCARHYLRALLGKENYGMSLDTGIKEPGYLAGRLFAVCENIQKRGRNWGPTLSDKLFSAAINLPKQSLVQLYTNCLCYDICKTDSEWLTEIFDKVKLSEGASGHGEVLTENSVDEFAFLLGYWHQRGMLTPKDENAGNGNNGPQ